MDWSIKGAGIVSQVLLATDDDRDRTVGALNNALARGALGLEEHEQRVARAWEARDTLDLASLTTDLPAPTKADAINARNRSEVGQWLAEWRYWCGGAVIMATVWGVQAARSGPRFFWPVVPLGIWAAVLLAVAIWPRPDNE